MVTLVVVLVLACVLGAVLAAYSGWSPTRVIRRTTYVDRPTTTDRVVEERQYVER